MGQLTDIPKKIWANDTFRMLFIAAGIMICFLFFGVMQEKIMKTCFGGELEGGKCSSGEQFTFELTLVCMLTLWYAVFAKGLLHIKVLNAEEGDKTHWGWYGAAALLYIFAMVSGNMALRWITYPTQTIAKSSKPLPVMILGMLLANKRYTIQKYIFVLLIVVGIIMFVYKDGKAEEGESNSDLGLILIGLSLMSDGLLGAVEDCMRAKTKPTALNFMFKINFFSTMILAVGIIATGEVVGFYEFARKYPDVYLKIGSAALVGSLGQVFIFMMISEFGPLPCAIATTTRKLFTVLISVIFMGNPLTSRQQIATIIVFGALFADALWGKKQLCGKPLTTEIPSEDPDHKKKWKLKEVEMEKLNGKKEIV